MKTILEHLESLPETCRAQAIDNMSEDARSKERDSPFRALSAAFTWNESPQGHAYWSRVSRHLVSPETQPPPEPWVDPKATARERLSPGNWCRPSSEKEWRAALELADALELAHLTYFGTYERNKNLSFSDGMVVQTDGACPGDPLTVVSFISRMYAEAEARKAHGSFVRYEYDGHKWVDTREEHRTLLKRLEALEAAFDEHLRRHREMGL